VRLEVGRIGRPHGLRGEVMVDLVTDRRERVTPGSVLYTPSLSLTVVSARPQQRRWIVVFEGYHSRDAVEPLVGQVLSADSIEDSEALWVHDLIGSRVVEQRTGHDRGEVISVLENPAHDLLELDSGALVPMPFVVSFAEGVVVIDPPDGLFDV
jgi:16S rRNA processing protein RimM